jgi:hypothetical protein
VVVLSVKFGALRSPEGALAAIAAGDGPAAARLEAWVLALVEAKRHKVLADPELFATYHAVATAARQVVEAHVATLRGQRARIVRDGVAAGALRPVDPDATAAALFAATAAFHHPYHVAESAGRPVADECRAVLQLLLGGLRADRA